MPRCPRQVGCPFPVRLAGAAAWIRGPEALSDSVEVGERALILGMRADRQNQIREGGERSRVDRLNDEELETLQETLDRRRVRGNFAAHGIQGPHAARL